MLNVAIEFDVEGELSDGTILRANVYRPSEGGPYPVLLSRLPYGKDSGALQLVDPVQLAAQGYIVVIQDCRGRYSSDGEFKGFRQEFQDGYDSVQWAAQLPNSNGKVGMFGTSYYGFTQWAAAALSPPALQAICPVFTFTEEWNGSSVKGGAFDWGKSILWYLQDIAPDFVHRSQQDSAERQSLMQSLYYEIEHLPTDGYWRLPLDQFPQLKKLAAADELFEQFDHPRRDEYWDSFSALARYPNSSIPNYNIAGWYDLFCSDTISNFQEMRKRGAPSYLLIGPWSHMNRSNHVGQLTFPIAANENSVEHDGDFTTLHRRWFDAALKSEESSHFQSEYPVKIFVMGANEWRSEAEWPLERTQYTPYYLESCSGGQRDNKEGCLTTQPSEMNDEFSASDSYVYNPSDPVPTVGGSTLLHSDFQPGPCDQREIEARDDMLVYTTPPFQEDTEVTGHIHARLWVASSAKDTDFVVRLTDVYPDGRSICLCDGILRMRFRNSWEHPELMVPGTVYEVSIDCGVTSNVFKAGHCIRVDISSSNFPRWNRNLNTGKSNELSDQFVTANQTVYHDKSRPSHIVLPIIPRQN